LKAARIAALVSFNGYRQLQIKYDAEDKVLEKNRHGLIKDIKAFYIRVKKSHNSPIKKKYSGSTVFPGIAIPFPPST
jgi:hypothetical protein